MKMKKITQIRYKQNQAQSQTQIYYILNVSEYDDASIFKAQIMKKLSNTEAELKKSVAYKKNEQFQ